MANSESFLWGIKLISYIFSLSLKLKIFFKVCELNKDQPIKTWKATDLTEDDDADDQDYVLHSLVVKTAVLGGKAVEKERNIVALKTKGYHDKEFEQPIFSLTLGRNDMVKLKRIFQFKQTLKLCILIYFRLIILI